MVYQYKDFLPQIHESCFIAPGSSVIGNVKMGKDSSVWFNAVLRGDIEEIVIGERTNIQDGSVLHCIHHVGIYLGNDVTIGHGAVLHSCSIGDCSLIGMGAIVLDEVKIGRNCLIGAGAVVTPRMEIPDGSLVLGSPARIKRQLTEEEIAHIKANALEYITLSEDYKKEG